jgi:two-component system, NarL family, response regulator DesR
MNAGVSCLLADDHPPILRSVAQVLQEWGFTVVASTGDGADALRKIEELRPVIALVDLRLPGVSGVEIAREAARTSPETAVLIYTGYGGAGLYREILDSGARGFVVKDAPLEDLRRALNIIAAGGIYVDPAASSQLLGVRETNVTQRERDVLRRLAQGLSNDQIGEQLYISGQTVRTHVRKASSKLGAQNRTQAVALAMRAGLID